MAVAVTARTAAEIAATVQQIEQDGGRALAIPADVTDASAVAQMVATVERHLGPVDLLVNNAGIARAFALIAEVGEVEEGTYVPIERSVDLVLLLASGQADALSGRFLSIEDDVNELVRRSAEIERDDLYTLQIHKLATIQESL